MADTTRLELKGGPGSHQVDILIDGERPDWWIDRITLDSKGGDVVRAIIELEMVEADVDVEVVDGLQLPENTVRALKALGWTPPVGDS